MPQKTKSVVIKDQQGKDRVCKFIQAFKLTKPVQITFKEYKPVRSWSQNATLWMWHHDVAAEISLYTGKYWSAEAVHYRVFCPKFLRGEVVELPDGTKAWASETSSNQNKMDLADAMTNYQAWCIDNGIELRDPVEMMGEKLC